MLVEDCRDAVLRGMGSAYLFAFALGVCHPGLYSGPDDGKFQFGKHCAHLNECLAHRLDVPVPAINRDAAEDFQTQMLRLDDVDDFAELLCASAQTRDFTAYDGISRLFNAGCKVSLHCYVFRAVS